MTVFVAQQRAYVGLVQSGLRITQQRAYVAMLQPVIQIAQQRAYVAIFPADDGGHRRMSLM